MHSLLFDVHEEFLFVDNTGILTFEAREDGGIKEIMNVCNPISEITE